MRVLLVKLSSLGDIIHTLPAVTDAARYCPHIRFDWVVEPGFQDLVRLHPQVDRVILAPLRRWRKQQGRMWWGGELWRLIREVRQEPYDLILDVQGLLKSVWLARLARGLCWGWDWRSARESSASLFYHRRLTAPWEWHAVSRIRHFFAQALGYTFVEEDVDYGLTLPSSPALSPVPVDAPYFVFLHGTTWANKHWPQVYWEELAQIINQQGFQVYLPWGNTAERKRALQIAQGAPQTWVLPRLGLKELIPILQGAKGSFSVDTGLAHLAAALGVSNVSLYGPTDPIRSGCLGPNQHHMRAHLPCAPCLKRSCQFKGNYHRVEPPCFAALQPQSVFEQWCNVFQ